MERLINFIFNISGQFWIGVLSSAFVMLIAYIINAIKMRSSGYSGDWESEVFSTENTDKVVVRSKYKLKHKKADGTITGTLKRIIPSNDKRLWRCTWKQNQLVTAEDVFL